MLSYDCSETILQSADLSDTIEPWSFCFCGISKMQFWMNERVTLSNFD